MMIKILHWSQNKKIFHKLADKRLEEITDLDKKVNSDDLTYRYKGRTADAKFDKFGNALDILDKIRNGEINLADVKNKRKKAHKGKRKKQKKHPVQYWNALQSKKRGY